MKLTRTDLCFCRYICCACSVVVMLHVDHFFFGHFMGIKFSEDFYSRTFNFAIFFTIKEREIEDPSKISTSKIFVPASSNKVFVQE